MLRELNINFAYNDTIKLYKAIINKNWLFFDKIKFIIALFY